MAFIEYVPEILLSLACFISFYLFYKTFINNGTSIPTTWPVIGMIPALIRNMNCLHDYATLVLKDAGGTIWLRGPWYAGMEMLITSDPANINYMTNKHFPNFPNGPKSREIFDIFGDAIFNSDPELWELHRKTYMHFLHHPEFMKQLEATIWNKVEKGLMPFLEQVSEQGTETNLQETFQHFTFDNICKLTLDYDPESLSLELPYIPCEKAFPKMEQALLHRHIVPETVWKLQKRLQIGREKILTNARNDIDQFIFKCIAMKQQELITRKQGSEDPEFSLLTAFMTAYKDRKGSTGNPVKFLRDTLFNVVIAGKDTTSTALSWFFYLVAKNQSAMDKILEEICTNLKDVKEGDKKWKVFNAKDELPKFVYLHAALCETLRLYPPVALQHKAPIQDDVLPSGHRVPKESKIILAYYSMGRMESIWGKDCLEYRPERWILEKGGIKHIPSYKFTAFHSGPRTCLGKEITFMQMKIIAITVLSSYNVELVEGHPVTVSDSVVIQMKHGLKVKLTKRNEAKN